jgi:hypothetical protein
MTTPTRARTVIGRYGATAAAVIVAAAAFTAIPPSAGSAAPTGIRSTDSVPGSVYFQSPSGNISCVLSASYARCDVDEYSYTPPPRPASCDFDWGQTLELKRRARFGCVSDTVAISDRVLHYGDSLSRGDKTCTSRRSGMVCRNLDTGHGFRMSRYGMVRFSPGCPGRRTVSEAGS